MNFLQLCQRVRQDCGISGTGPASTLNQTGENKRIVDWVSSAYEDLQLKRSNWYWMRGNFEFNTTIDKANYTPIEAGIFEVIGGENVSNFAQWDNETIRLWPASESETNARFIPYISYQHYLMSRMTPADNANRPSRFTVMPNLSLQLAPKPDAVYAVKGDYFKKPHILVTTLEVPALPDQFHMAIVYRAMMMYARYEAAGEIYADAEANYRRLVNRIEANQLPMMEMAQPLA